MAAYNRICYHAPADEMSSSIRYTKHGCITAMILATGLAGAPGISQVVIAQSAETATTEGEVLGRFEDQFGFERIYVKLRPGLNDAQLIAFGREWHAKEPKGWVWFLDDDAKVKQLLASLPETEKGDLSNFPAEWVATHSLGHIQMEILPGGGRRWTLMPKAERAGEPLAILESP